MLEPGHVEIWFARPSALDDAPRRAAALALLTDGEQARVARFHLERDRRLHLAARALLRRALSRHAPVDPAAWRFDVGPRGRPEISAPASPLRFSVSHTDGVAAVALAHDRAVGLDVEGLPAPVPWEIVDRELAAAERAALRGARAEEQSARFAELWTLKEAYAKARGLGLALPLDATVFETRPPRLVAGDDPGAWHLELFVPTAAHRAALCVARRGPERVRVDARWDGLDEASRRAVP